MPFKSEKQRKFLWANKPEVAKKYARHGRKGNGELGYKKKMPLGDPFGYSKKVPVKKEN